MKYAEDRQGTELSAHREVLIYPAVGGRVSVGKLRHGGDSTTKESREALNLQPYFSSLRS